MITILIASIIFGFLVICVFIGGNRYKSDYEIESDNEEQIKSINKEEINNGGNKNGKNIYK